MTGAAGESDEPTEPSAPGDEPTLEVSSEPAPTSSATPEATVRCWDETVRPDLAGCPRLRGREATQWVFAGVDLGGCQASFLPGERVAYACLDASGTRRYTVSQWVDFDAGATHYGDSPGGSPAPIDGDRLRWDGYSRNGDDAKSALMYADERWGVTVYGDTVAERDAMVAALGMRSVQQVRRFS